MRKIFVFSSGSGGGEGRKESKNLVTCYYRMLSIKITFSVTQI